jgi:hypothetical protein
VVKKGELKINIFILDYDVVKCAQYHNNSHVVKMILETTQLLNNALIKHNDAYVPVYKQTHKNHPCSVFVGENISNFNWTLSLGFELCKEYTYRYGRQHKCQDIIDYFDNCEYKKNIPNGELTQFKLCMPDIYKTNDAVESYRNYYKSEKRNIALWTKRNIPEWWQ